MDESPDFVDVFKSVRGDMVLVNDQEFAKKVLQAMPIKIFFYQWLNGIHFLQKDVFSLIKCLFQECQI